MLNINEELPDIEQLERYEFDLDVEEQTRLQQEAKEAVLQVSIQIMLTEVGEISWFNLYIKYKYWIWISLFQKTMGLNRVLSTGLSKDVWKTVTTHALLFPLSTMSVLSKETVRYDTAWHVIAVVRMWLNTMSDWYMDFRSWFWIQFFF